MIHNQEKVAKFKMIEHSKFVDGSTLIEKREWLITEEDGSEVQTIEYERSCTSGSSEYCYQEVEQELQKIRRRGNQ